MHLLQVCNVGNICGGTAACAWTISQAFPDCTHTVIFLSRPSEETIVAFSGTEVLHRQYVDGATIERINPDVVILHNISAERFERSEGVMTIQYHHSAGTRANAHQHIACSKWLAHRLSGEVPVLYQAVPIPIKPDTAQRRELTDELVIGRICSPQLKKWPSQLINLYEHLSKRHPNVNWEFVGAPTQLQNELQQACGDKATFHSAGFDARQHLWNWHALLYHHPTLTESFGRTVAEGMRCGCLPIVDDRGGFCEQIEHAQTGFLCSNIAEFSTAIASISQAQQWWQLSRNAAASANERFSLRMTRERLLEVMRS